jgi:hemerythrin superfamily protein
MAKQEFTDGIMLLKNDHRVVEEFFNKFEKATGDGRKQQIAEQICTELKIHSMLEEEIFYPAFQGKIEEADLQEAYVEHDSAKVLINDIMAGGPKEDDFYDAKVKVLQEEIEHHIKEEEQGKQSIFGQARQTDVDLVALRDQMAQRKSELLAKAESEGLPPAQLSAVQVENA